MELDHFRFFLISVAIAACAVAVVVVLGPYYVGAPFWPNARLTKSAWKFQRYGSSRWA